MKVGNRMIRRINILIIAPIFLSITGLIFLYAQEKLDTREEARQHYQEGKSLYSQGRYQEATAEFEKAITLVTPAEIQFEERIQREQEKILAPGSSQETASGLKTATTLIIPPEIEFEERIQKEGEKVLTPAVPKVSPPKEKLIEKKKEEKKETGVTGTTIEAPETETGEREYYIDIGDVLDISVWQIADLSRSEIIVRPDGKISFPLIGDIKTEGLTLTQLDNVITEKLKAYVKGPEVSIMIRRFGEQTNKVIVLGEILSPGVYKFGSRPTITEVIAAAGGYTKYAVLNSIMVINGDVRTKPKVTRVNFAQIIKSGRLTENIFLKPNDIIYIPRSFIGKLNVFLEIFQPAISEYMQTMNARHFHNVMHRNQ